VHTQHITTPIAFSTTNFAPPDLAPQRGDGQLARAALDLRHELMRLSVIRERLADLAGVPSVPQIGGRR
jgi:hypothetical protein